MQISGKIEEPFPTLKSVAQVNIALNRLQKNSNVTAAHRSELEKPSKIAPKLRFWRHFWPKYRILSLLRHPKNPFSAAC